jgi:hypothetical protein
MVRINRTHVLFPGAVNHQGKHWAYTLNRLGQVDTSVVADAPNYGVFCSGGTVAGCAGGTRTFVGHNPTTNTLTVTFRLADDGTRVAQLVVAPGAMVAQPAGGVETTYTPTTTGVDSSRLYLSKPTTVSATCDPITPAPALSLTLQPGAWLPISGTAPFPADASALNDSVICVPARPDTVGTNLPPAAPYVRTWTGTFFGTYSQTLGATRFAIYSNQSLVPGWQLDPCVAGGDTRALPSYCPGAAISATFGANAYVMQVSYDFNGDGAYDRIEQYRNQSLIIGNVWTNDNKQTHLKWNQLWPNSPPDMVLGGPDGTRIAPFPTFVTFNPAMPPTIKVDLYGGTITGGLDAQFPVAVSVNANPLTDRASWIQPPYRTGLSGGTRLLYFPWMPQQQAFAHPLRRP